MLGMNEQPGASDDIRISLVPATKEFPSALYVTHNTLEGVPLPWQLVEYSEVSGVEEVRCD
jgi:hypothetical protein